MAVIASYLPDVEDLRAYQQARTVFAIHLSGSHFYICDLQLSLCASALLNTGEWWKE